MPRGSDPHLQASASEGRKESSKQTFSMFNLFGESAREDWNPESPPGSTENIHVLEFESVASCHQAPPPAPLYEIIEATQVLYYFVQFVCHSSHPISGDPGNNFLSILAEFGDLSEKLLITCIYELNEMVQYTHSVRLVPYYFLSSFLVSIPLRYICS
jgi:hypothetical protein